MHLINSRGFAAPDNVWIRGADNVWNIARKGEIFFFLAVVFANRRATPVLANRNIKRDAARQWIRRAESSLTVGL